LGERSGFKEKGTKEEGKRKNKGKESVVVPQNLLLFWLLL